MGTIGTTSPLGITVHGFEPLDVCGLRLAPGLDVIVGPNGVGKSRLLDALTGELPSTSADGGVLVHYPSFVEDWHYDVVLSAMPQAVEFAEHSGVHWRTPSSAEDLETYATGLAGGVLFEACSNYQVDTDGEFFHSVWSSMMNGHRYVLWREDGGWGVWLGLRGEDAEPRLASLIHGGGISEFEEDAETLRLVLGTMAWWGNASLRIQSPWWLNLFDHPWASAPLVRIGHVRSGGPEIMRLESSMDDPDADTWDVLRLATASFDHPGTADDLEAGPRQTPLFERAPGGELSISGSWRAAAEPLEVSASSRLALMVDDPPPLELNLDPSSGSRPDVCSWVLNTPRGRIPLAESSDGLRRWGTVAVEMSLADVWPMLPVEVRAIGRRPRLAAPNRVLVLDEPERAIHRRSELRLGEALPSLLAPTDQLVVATHSTGLLCNRRARTSTLGRTANGSSVLRPLDWSQVDGGMDIEGSLEAAGVMREDLLLLTRLFILVEGHHEELVFNGLFGDDLARWGAKVLNTGGVTGLKSAVNSRFLFEYSAARVLIVTDRIDPTRAAGIRDEAVALAERGRADAAAGLIITALSGKLTEESHLKKALLSALDAGALSRLHVHPLLAEDILDLLPCDAFVPGKTWPVLRADHVAHHGGGSFKKFMKDTHGVDFAVDSVITDAIDEMDQIPPQLTELLEAIRSVAGFEIR